MRVRHPRSPRSGVILIVVLGLLTLLEIVGLSFATYAQTAQAAAREFRTDAFDLAQQAVATVPPVRRDLLQALAGDTDFADSHDAIDSLASRAAALKARVREAHEAATDPAERQSLEQLCARLESLLQAIQRLECLIQDIEQGRQIPSACRPSREG